MLSFEPLTPTAFLRRCASVNPERIAVVDGSSRWNYGELWARARRLAGALGELDVPQGGRVAVLAANSHTLLEAHYGVPLAGAVLVALNMRLSPRELGYILEHSEATVLLCDSQLEALGRHAIAASDTGARLVSAAEYEHLVEGSSERACVVDDDFIQPDRFGEVPTTAHQRDLEDRALLDAV